MRIRYTKRAFLDRETIYDYLDERSPKGAVNIQRAIVRAIRALETYPGLGRLTDLAGVRELVVPRYPYKIYYRIGGRRDLGSSYPRRLAPALAGILNWPETTRFGRFGLNIWQILN